MHVHGLGVVPQFLPTERGAGTIAMIDPAHPLIHTIESEDEPAGDQPGTGQPMTVTEMHDSLARVLGVSVPLAVPSVGSLATRVSPSDTGIVGSSSLAKPLTSMPHQVVPD